ncbi:MAG: thiamine pyrophosphate-dependent dehydrogenase E1 component subunit alpha [Acidobacteria bacterium]|nr:thiamine pyrophosphate-dependent dehydrogenase E1 component subunit alpha [Acidobacteriota bacterium]
MIRYPAFDPPEYVNWQADRQILDEYANTIEAYALRRDLVRALRPAQLIAMYEGLIRNRLHDIALKRWVKQGVISKAWLGIGEEAATIGVVHALQRPTKDNEGSTDFVAPMIRNAGACHEMGMKVADMLRGYLGTADSPTRGRDLHIGDFPHGVLAPVSPVGDIMAVTAGVALSFKQRRQPRVALTWIGDGSTKSGVFHETMNFAAVQNLPMVVIIQNNQVALGTRLDQHHRSNFADWPQAYGVKGAVFDGNHVLDAYAAAKLAVDGCRNGEGPFLLIAETFRMGGHATHDEREARETFDAKLFAHYGKRDPIGMFENYLIEGTLDLSNGRRMRRTTSMQERNAECLRQAEERVTAEVEQASAEALQSRAKLLSPPSAGTGVYANEEIVTSRKLIAVGAD